MVQGERVVDVIQDALEAKEAAKEAKKVSCPSLADQGDQLTRFSVQDRVSVLPRRSAPRLHLPASGRQRLALPGNGWRQKRRLCPLG